MHAVSGLDDMPLPVAHGHVFLGAHVRTQPIKLRSQDGTTASGHRSIRPRAAPKAIRTIPAGMSGPSLSRMASIPAVGPANGNPTSLGIHERLRRIGNRSPSRIHRSPCRQSGPWHSRYRQRNTPWYARRHPYGRAWEHPFVFQRKKSGHSHMYPHSPRDSCMTLRNSQSRRFSDRYKRACALPCAARRPPCVQPFMLPHLGVAEVIRGEHRWGLDPGLPSYLVK